MRLSRSPHDGARRKGSFVEFWLFGDFLLNPRLFLAQSGGSVGRPTGQCWLDVLYWPSSIRDFQ